MCGRYKISADPAHIATTFRATFAPGYAPVPRYNIAPTHVIPVVRLDDGKRMVVPMRWGLIPFWAKDPTMGARLINARVETVHEKPAFRSSLGTHRCLVVSDGFYEWAGTGKHKQPWLIRFDDNRVFAFAGLWSRWRGPEGLVETCTVITTPPNRVAGRIHDRMPLLFDPSHDQALLDAWLDCSVPADIVSLATPREHAHLVAVPVDKRVGNVKNEGPFEMPAHNAPMI